MNISLQNSKKAFTLIELLVVIAIIAILAAILFPVFGRARENARRSSCQSNMKQVGLSFLQYAQDYDEKPPSSLVGVEALAQVVAWDYALEPYMIKAGSIATTFGSGQNPLLRCPSDSILPSTPTTRTKRSYAVPQSNATNGDLTWKLDNFANVQVDNGRNMAEFPSTATTLLMVEAPNSANKIYTNQNYRCTGPTSASSTAANWMNTQDGAGGGMPTGVGESSLSSLGKKGQHFDGYNYLFVDGHVKFLRPEATVRTAGVTYPFTNANGFVCGGSMTAPCGMWTVADND